MKWIQKLLNIDTAPAAEASSQSPEIIAIQNALTSVDEDKAPFVACLALLTARVAGADLDISDGEKQRISQVLQDKAKLTPGEAQAAAEIALAHEVGKTLEQYRVVDVMNEMATLDQKKDVIRSLFFVACDEDISEVESEKIRSISKGLLLSNEVYIHIRSEFSEHRSLLKKN